MTGKSPASQLAGFIAKFTPEAARKTRACIAKMRKLVPGALELVYDNYNALAIGYGPTERASEAIFSIAVFPKRPSLCFIYGAKLSDPKGLLSGGGNQVRFINLEDPGRLDEPGVRALMKQAMMKAKVPLDPKQKRRTIIKAISKKQRPRRPAKP